MKKKCKGVFVTQAKPSDLYVGVTIMSCFVGGLRVSEFLYLNPNITHLINYVKRLNTNATCIINELLCRPV